MSARSRGRCFFCLLALSASAYAAPLDRRAASLERAVNQAEAEYADALEVILDGTTLLERDFGSAAELEQVARAFSAENERLAAALQALRQRLASRQSKTLPPLSSRLEKRIRQTHQHVGSIVADLEERLGAGASKAERNRLLLGLFYAWMSAVTAGALIGLLALADFVETMRTRRAAARPEFSPQRRVRLYFSLRDYIEARTAAATLTVGLVLTAAAVLTAARPSLDLLLLAVTIITLWANAFIALTDYALSLVFAERCPACGKNLVYARRIHLERDVSRSLSGTAPASALLIKERLIHPAIAACPFCRTSFNPSAAAPAAPRKPDAIAAAA